MFSVCDVDVCPSVHQHACYISDTKFSENLNGGQCLSSKMVVVGRFFYFNSCRPTVPLLNIKLTLLFHFLIT